MKNHSTQILDVFHVDDTHRVTMVYTWQKSRQWSWVAQIGPHTVMQSAALVEAGEEQIGQMMRTARTEVADALQRMADAVRPGNAVSAYDADEAFGTATRLVSSILNGLHLDKDIEDQAMLEIYEAISHAVHVARRVGKEK